MIQITLPLPRYRRKGKSKLLTLNDYRNMHYAISNNAKHEYANTAWLHLRPHRKKRYNRISIEYVLYFDTGHRRDIGNVGSITDKFFSDALVDSGIIDDDSQQYVTEVSFRYGGIGPERVEITIKEIA